MKLPQFIRQSADGANAFLKGAVPSPYDAAGNLRTNVRVIQMPNGDVIEKKFDGPVPAGWRPQIGEIMGAELLNDEEHVNHVGDPLAEYTLSIPLRNWSSDMADNRYLLTLGDAYLGVLAVALPGAGKTSAIGPMAIMPLLRLGCGGLVLAAKVEDIADWIKWAKECGREEDLIIFSPASGHRFNFLEYTALASRRSSATGTVNIADLVNIVDELCELVSRQQGKRDHDFWMKSGLVVLKYAFVLAELCNELNLDFIEAIVDSCPSSLKEAQSPTYQSDRSKACARAMLDATAAVELMTGAAQQTKARELERARRFWLNSFPRQPDDTRGSIIATLQMLVSNLGDDPLYSLFLSGSSTVTPDDIIVRDRTPDADGKPKRAKIVIVGLPVHDDPLLGRIANGILKSAVQKAAVGRATAKNDDSFIPAFIYADEAQLFALKSDPSFQAVCRSYRIVNIALTQTLISNIVEYGGDASAENTVRAYFSLLQTKIFGRNDEPKTIEFIQEAVVGKGYVDVASSNLSLGGALLSGGGIEGASLSSGSAQQLAVRILHEEIATLRTGGAANDYNVDVIVSSCGHKLPGGKTWFKYTINQKTQF